MLTLFLHSSQGTYDSSQQQTGYWVPRIFVPNQYNFSCAPRLSVFVIAFCCFFRLMRVLCQQCCTSAFFSLYARWCSLATSSSSSLQPHHPCLSLSRRVTPFSHIKLYCHISSTYSLSLFSFPLPITSTSLSSCQPPPSLCQWQQPQWLCLLLHQASPSFLPGHPPHMGKAPCQNLLNCYFSKIPLWNLPSGISWCK